VIEFGSKNREIEHADSVWNDSILVRATTARPAIIGAALGGSGDENQWI
jgi:hypothetical protein